MLNSHYNQQFSVLRGKHEIQKTTLQEDKEVIKHLVKYFPGMLHTLHSAYWLPWYLTFVVFEELEFGNQKHFMFTCMGLMF